MRSATSRQVDIRARQAPRRSTPPSARPGERYRIQAIDRAAGILNCFEFDQPELSVREIAARTGLHKSTAHRILMALHYNGLIDQDLQTGNYHLGIKLFKLGQEAVARLKLREVVKPFLKQLMEQTKETTYLAVLDGANVVYLDRVEGPHALGMPYRPGRCDSTYCTALGKAMLACLPEDEIPRHVPSGEWYRHTPKTLRNVGELLEQLRVVRKRGYALIDEEGEIGLRSIGAPVRDYSGAMVGAISIAGPSARLKQSEVPALGELVKTAAHAISSQLGHGKVGATART